MDTWTVVLAVTGFLAGQYALRLVLEPAVEARKQVVGVRTTYDFYRNVAMNPPAPGTSVRPDQLQASEALRRAAGELRAVAPSVLFYDWVRRPFDLPSRDHLESVARNLIGLSNNLFGSSSMAVESAIRHGDEIREAIGW